MNKYEELADKLDVSRQSVSKWEQGINEPDFETTKKLCQILDCSIAELIDDDQEVITTKEEKDANRAKWLFRVEIILAIWSTLMIIALAFATKKDIIKHWDSSGHAEYGSKWYLLINLVIILVAIVSCIFSYVFIARKKRYGKYKVLVESIALVFESALIITVGVISAIQVKDAVPLIPNAANLLVVAVFALLASAGILTHPHFNKRNPLFGFRTNFTLSNEEAWNKVNAFASICLTICSFISYCLVVAFINYEWAVWLIGAILVGLIISAVYHEIVRHKLKKVTK